MILLSFLAGLGNGLLLGVLACAYCYRKGYADGLPKGGAMVCDSLIEALHEPQYMTGVNVLYLLRRMKGEKA